MGPAELTRALGRGSGAVLRLPLEEDDGRRREPEEVRLDALASTRWRISYTGPPGTLTAFPAGPLVALARSGQDVAADNPFRDRIVLVGGTFAMSRDFYPTPTGFMSGVEIQGNAVHTLLTRRIMRPPPWWLNLAVLLGACLVVAVASLWLRPLWATAASLALVATIVAASFEAYRRGGYWLDFVAPVAAMLIYQQGARIMARRRLRAAFGQYVSPEVMARVLRAGSHLGGEMREVTVLVSDLRGFTTLCERLAPAQVTEAMNEYLTAMVDRILAHRGMVSDFIGDGILAFFGAPVDDPEHPWHAVQTALEMQAALEALNARWTREGKLPLAMGIAVNTGRCLRRHDRRSSQEEVRGARRYGQHRGPDRGPQSPARHAHPRRPGDRRCRSRSRDDEEPRRGGGEGQGGAGRDLRDHWPGSDAGGRTGRAPGGAEGMRSGIRGWHPVLAVTLLALVLAPAAAAQSRDTVGLITEIKPGRGRVEVKPAAGGDWRVAGPLLALRAGDSVRATEDAAAVIVLTAGRGVVRVVAAVSPVVLPAGAGADGKADKALTLLESSLGFLSRTTKEPPKGVLATRSPVPPP